MRFAQWVKAINEIQKITKGVRELKKSFVFMLILLLTVSSFSIAFAEDDVVDTAVGAGNFTVLAEALEKADLIDTLKGDGPFTVFAPTDDAFAALLSDLGITKEELLARPDLKDILLYHVLSGSVPASDVMALQDGTMVKTLNGKKVKVSFKDGNVFVDSSKLVTTDVMASNGVIHAIDKVLIPGKDIVETAVDAGNFNTLATALTEAGLVDTLKGDGPFTVFAPTDEAFSKLLSEMNITAEDLLAKPELSDILLYHVLADKIMAEDVLALADGTTIQAANGKKLTLTFKDGNAYINDAMIVTTDIMTTNGVIHVIDDVLIPGAVPAEPAETTPVEPVAVEEPAAPVEPATPVEPAVPVEPTETVSSTDLADASQPALISADVASSERVPIPKTSDPGFVVLGLAALASGSWMLKRSRK